MLPKTKNKPEMPAVKPVKVEISTGIADGVRNALKDKEFFTEGIGIVNIPSSARELELQQEIFNVKFKYDSLLNYLKPLMSHDMLVAFGDKKKEIFG